MCPSHGLAWHGMAWHGMGTASAGTVSGVVHHRQYSKVTIASLLLIVRFSIIQISFAIYNRKYVQVIVFTVDLFRRNPIVGKHVHNG